MAFRQNGAEDVLSKEIFFKDMLIELNSRTLTFSLDSRTVQ